jgi:ADP-heptose:LPS heptosyltransferase
LGSTSNNPCSELLDYCLRGQPWPGELLDQALQVDDGRAFLSTVVERLADLFEPALSQTYDGLFRQVIERTCPELIPRLHRATETPAGPKTADRIYVLSRVTLGADVAVTSVLLDAAKRRYKDAEIVFVGPRKAYEMFEADPRVTHQPAPYARSGALAERLRASAALRLDDGVVIDSDSRLTQLGLLAVCEERNYFFFPSRSYGGDGQDRLPDLAARWAQEVFGVEGARPYIAPRPLTGSPADITVSLGVGENPAKQFDEEFERELIRALAETDASVLVDEGGTAEERERAQRALLPGMRCHDGAFAPFAAHIARSKLYVGYDSAGGHVASACGVPLISIAKGFANERAAMRWRPRGHVIREDSATAALARIRELLSGLLFRARG